MKRVIKLFLTISALAFSIVSCTGEDGLDGRDGRDGEETVIYELPGLTFDQSNDFLINEVIPSDIVTDSSDVIMVFRLLSTDPNVGDIWEQLPQVYFLEEGTLQYNFNFSQDDVDFFIDADFDLTTFENETYTDNQIFRIAVIPANDNTSAKLLTDSVSYSQISKGATLIHL